MEYASSWLQSLKSWSLRKSRGGSSGHARNDLRTRYNHRFKIGKTVPEFSAAPSCMHLRRKAFHPVEGWSVRIVAIVCKTVTTALRRSGNRSFTSMGPNKNIDAK